MKFSCPQCSTRYNVADEKVPENRTLRFTCKRCGNVFRLRRRGKSDAVKKQNPSPHQQATKKHTAPQQVARPVSFDLGATAPESTRVAKVDEILGIKERSREQPMAPTPSAPFVDQNEWFVLVKGDQLGPLTDNEVLKMFVDGKIDKRTYAWRDGMDDWQRLEKVPEFKDAANHAGDAAWRVVKPLPKQKKRPRALEDTVSMNINHLNEELNRLRAEQPAPEEPAGEARAANTMRPSHFGESTAVMSQAQIQAELAAAGDGHTRPMDARQLKDELAKARGDSLPSSPESALPRDYTDPGMLAALVDGDGPAMKSGDTGDGFDPFMNTQDMQHPNAPRQAPPPEHSGGGGELPGYLEAPPGEATRVFMATAGLFQRRRRHKAAAITGIFVTLLLLAVIAGDVTGLYEIPGMGHVYAGLNIEDTNVERAIEVTERKLKKSALSDAEKKKLRDKLLGLAGKRKGGGGGRKTAALAGGSGMGKGAKKTQGIVDKKTLSADERDFTADLFGDKRKTEKKLKDPKVTSISAPDLPDGLTYEVLMKQINENSSAMKLCIAQAMRANERLSGRMDVSMTISANGRVSASKVKTARFRNSVIGECTVKTVKRWRFPRFNGEPITVEFPYVLSEAL